jgi:hypothetical protein
MVNAIILFIVAVAFGVFGAMMGWSYITVIGIIIGLTILNILFYLLILTNSKDLKLITYVLKVNRKEPLFGYLLTLKDGNLEDAKLQLEKGIKKYKSNQNGPQFSFSLALLNNDVTAARHAALSFKDAGFREYALATIDCYEGKGEQHFSTSFSKPWMHHALVATNAFFKDDQDTYKQHKQFTLDHSKGLQLASNTYSFQFNEQLYPDGYPIQSTI